jgi:hypothetical protein
MVAKVREIETGMLDAVLTVDFWYASPKNGAEVDIKAGTKVQVDVEKGIVKFGNGDSMEIWPDEYKLIN